MRTEIMPPEPLRDRIRRHTFGYGVSAAVRLTAAWAPPVILGEENLIQAIAAGKGVILTAWHGTILLPIHHMRDRGYWALVSPSRDGQMEELAFRRLGWRTFVGSSRRGGVQAILGAIKRLRRAEVVAIVPDGPRGPARQIKPGTGYLAESARAAVIPIGSFAEKAWTLRTWDGFQIPKPGSRTAVCFGPPASCATSLPLVENSDNAASDFEEALAEAINAANQAARQAVEGG